MSLTRMNDRCDKCGVEALVRVGIGSLDLLFCGHHYNRHAASLKEQGATVLTDNREVKA